MSDDDSGFMLVVLRACSCNAFASCGLFGLHRIVAVSNSDGGKVCNSYFMTIETLGSYGESADAFIRELGRRIAVITGEKRATDFLRQRISVAIQRGNAACILATADAFDGRLDDIYFICKLSFLLL